MKEFIYIITFAIITLFSTVSINASDTLRTCFNKIQAVESQIQNLHRDNNTLKSELERLNLTISTQSSMIDSLKSALATSNNKIYALHDSLDINISSTKEQIHTTSDNLSQTIAKKSQTGMCFFIVLALVVAAIAFIFGRLIAKRGSEVASISAKADKFNEEIVNRLSSEMSEMHSLSKQIGSISTAIGGGTDSEQMLIITLADRITFMEMTLYKMDSSVRGYKQLYKSIKQMKDNLLANGYELVDMLGKEYHDGMKVIANFVEDENLPDGKHIITGIIKPQINFQGKMIQSAQITVSHNS